mgnify:CR=1 FL=1
MADVKEKINLLDVIPFRSENITAEKGCLLYTSDAADE